MCFVRPGHWNNFIMKWYKSIAQLQCVSRNTTSSWHHRCPVYCEPYLVSVPPPSLVFCLLWAFSSFLHSLLKLFFTLSCFCHIHDLIPSTNWSFEILRCLPSSRCIYLPLLFPLVSVMFRPAQKNPNKPKVASQCREAALCCHQKGSKGAKS